MSGCDPQTGPLAPHRFRPCQVSSQAAGRLLSAARSQGETSGYARASTARPHRQISGSLQGATGSSNAASR